MRLLWLSYERSPHPDAICHPATIDDAEFVIALLRRPYSERIRLTEQLARFLSTQERLTPTERLPIACRTPSGLYRSVPWRLAKWLRHVLPATESVIKDTIARVEWWQHQSSAELTCLSPTS